MTVQGARSPRFALMTRMVIRSRFGVPYLDRLRIVDTPWFGVYLHHIKGPDPQPDPHDHPWNFVSVVLRGGYTEEIVSLVGSTALLTYRRRWLPLTAHKMAGAGVAHRILTAKPNTVTLVLRGKRSWDWGFWAIDNNRLVGWIDWKDYEL